MRLETRTVLEIAAGLLLAATVGCFAVAGWLDDRKHALSGVPTGHFALNQDGRFFHVPRGGPPVDQRPQVPLTAEQYRLWKENEQSASLWAGRAALCFLGAVGTAVWPWLAGPGRQSAEPGAAPDRSGM